MQRKTATFNVSKDNGTPRHNRTLQWSQNATVHPQLDQTAVLPMSLQRDNSKITKTFLLEYKRRLQ
eukprot:6475308-Amphidinium_carterae.1